MATVYLLVKWLHRFGSVQRINMYDFMERIVYLRITHPKSNHTQQN